MMSERGHALLEGQHQPLHRGRGDVGKIEINSEIQRATRALGIEPVTLAAATLSRRQP